jgi:hypothetical protein
MHSCTHLGIVVDTSTVDILSDRKPGRGFSNLKIRSLDLRDSRISQPAKVAAFLSDIFPELYTIHIFYDYDAITVDDAELFEKPWRPFCGWKFRIMTLVV